MKATEKQKINFKNYYQKNKEALVIKAREYQQEHKEEISVRRRLKYYHLKELGLLPNKRRKKSPAYQRDYNLTRKKTILSHYSKGNNVCAWCGFNDIRALSIDHMSGGGEKHRKSIGISSGNNFYRWLINNHYPNGYQVLCMNCQAIKRRINNENSK